MKLPLDFVGSMETCLGNEIGDFLKALDDEPAVSIRLNPAKTKPGTRFFVPAEPVPWSRWGYYLEERPSFTFDPLLHAGIYYVQEASSMFVDHVVRELLSEPAVCLDLCAAPGGKSLSLLSSLPTGSLLVSNEVVRQRANILAETIIKHGHTNVMVTNNTPADFGRLTHAFDLILVDAPCSGEGMFRKNIRAVEEWSLNNVQRCAERQNDILVDAWQALKPGGFLVYSTCTFNVTENESVVFDLARSTGARFIQVETGSDWGISPSFDERTPGYRFFPHRTRGEGLSLFILWKPTEETITRKKFSIAEELITAEGTIPPEQPVTTSNSIVEKRGGDSRCDDRRGVVEGTCMDIDERGWGGKKRRGKKKSYKGKYTFLKDPSAFESYFHNPGAFRFLERGQRVFALPAMHFDSMMAFDEKLRTVSMGIEVGEFKKGDFIPSHALALNRELHTESFPRFPVAYNQAIAYFRKEAIVLPGAPRGMLLLTYEDEPIGFAKNVGNRANNLYPDEWRIRSIHLSECIPRVVDTSS